jgi:hypothetical protein
MPGQIILAGPPEGVSGRMVLDEVADGLRKFRKERNLVRCIECLKQLTPAQEPRVAEVWLTFKDGRVELERFDPVHRPWTERVCVGLTLAYGLFQTSSRPHRINKEGFDKITKGMTQQEVEDTLGRPPGDYTDRREVDYFGLGNPYRPPVKWTSDEGEVVVIFNEGRVWRKRFYPVDNRPERPWSERVCRVLSPAFVILAGRW